MCIMAPEPISTAYFINPSHQSVCPVCVSPLSLLGIGSVKCIPPFIARQRLGIHVSAVTNTPNSRRIVGRAIFYEVCVLENKVSVGPVVVPPIVARYELGEDVPVAT
jgi:hypothetical protein